MERIALDEADVVVLPEFRETTRSRLEASEFGSRWTRPLHTYPESRENGIGILCRLGLRPTRRRTQIAGFKHRLLAVTLLKERLQVVAVHGPLDGEDADYYWTNLLRWLRRIRHEPVLVIGDFNTGEAGVDAYKNPFWCSDHFLRLRDIGYTDLWRRHNPGRTEHTWFSRRGGVDLNGFRLDHAFGSDTVVERLVHCRYLGHYRGKGFTDHAGVEVSIAPA